jgi:hypothetical protein
VDAPHWNGDDEREFGPVHDLCKSCGGDLGDEGHDPACEWHPNYYDVRVRDVEPVAEVE